MIVLRDRLKIWLHYWTPKTVLTKFAGWMAQLTYPVVKNYLIQDFIRRYNVNMQEACFEDPQAYACFNDFFIRRLKPASRPIAAADLVSPVDGCVSQIGRVSQGQVLQAKGHLYSVHELLACDETISSSFEHASFVTLYLSPKDYHRVHMPIEARVLEMAHVPGTLFSVQPTTVNAIPQLFARNERLSVIFETDAGLMAMVLVGATIVGAIGTAWTGDLRRDQNIHRYVYSTTPELVLQKAADMGYFKLGSTVILLFADSSRMQWRTDLKSGDHLRFGEALGTCS